MKFRTWSKKKQEFFISEDSLLPKKKDEYVNRCTNFYDKNDKDIYEGDILEHSDDDLEHYYLVIFDEWTSRFRIVNFEYPVNTHQTNIEDITDFHNGNSCEMEIIGNIYETPEFILKNFY